MCPYYFYSTNTTILTEQTSCINCYSSCVASCTTVQVCLLTFGGAAAVGLLCGGGIVRVEGLGVVRGGGVACMVLGSGGLT